MKNKTLYGITTMVITLLILTGAYLILTDDITTYECNGEDALVDTEKEVCVTATGHFYQATEVTDYKSKGIFMIPLFALTFVLFKIRDIFFDDEYY